VPVPSSREYIVIPANEDSYADEIPVYQERSWLRMPGVSLYVSFFVPFFGPEPNYFLVRPPIQNSKFRERYISILPTSTLNLGRMILGLCNGGCSPPTSKFTSRMFWRRSMSSRFPSSVFVLDLPGHFSCILLLIRTSQSLGRRCHCLP